MVNCRKYLERKNKGLVKLVKLGNVFAMIWKSFDPETGETKDAVVEAFKLEDIRKVREQMVAMTKDIDAVLTDLEAIK